MLPLPLPLSRLDLELIAGAVAIAGALIGLEIHDANERKIGAQACEARVAAVNAANHAQVASQSARNDALAVQLAASQVARKATHDTITKYVARDVVRPVYLSDCMDDAGLRDINAALAGTGTPDGASGAASAVPAASAPGR